MINSALLEMDTKKKEVAPSVFWALDPRLPRIAAQAAVEFDWLIQVKHGKSIASLSRESIRTLWWLLSESIGKAQLDTESKAFVDSVGLSLFVKAYNETHKAHPVKTRRELASAVKELTSSLEKAQQEEDLDEGILRKMMDFCVALSEYAAVYREVVYGNRQEHPYRK
jgi:hypothetical protein